MLALWEGPQTVVNKGLYGLGHPAQVPHAFPYPTDGVIDAKHRVFGAIDAMDPADRAGDGTEVRRVFAALLDEFPQMSIAAE